MVFACGLMGLAMDVGGAAGPGPVGRCLTPRACEGVSMQDRQVVMSEEPAGPAASPAVTAGGLIFVSALTAAGPDGAAPTGDVAAQTTRVFERLGRVLAVAGSSVGQTLTLHVYLKRAADFAAMNVAYREAVGQNPPTRTTVVADLGPGALVAISAIAVPDGAPREVLHPKGWIASPRPYSYVVRSGDLVFCSGLVSRRGTDDQSVPGSAAVQTKTILDNASVLLETAGLTYDDVVAARVFITDDAWFTEMNDTYRTYFPDRPPARATAVTDLMGSDAKVEITLIASAAPRQVIGPVVAPSLPLSTAVRAGRFVFLSGVLGNTDATRDDVAAQTREVLARVGRTLQTAGLAWADVVDNTIYLPDVWQAKTVHQVYGATVAAGPPARTTVGARLVVRTGLVEMMVTAVAPR
jgi:2-iminobutanoate/2-iminopropanoate deaminase